MIDLQKIRSIRQQITSDVELKNDIRKLVSRILLLSIGELQAENGSIFLIEDNMITFEILAYESSFSKVIEYKLKKAMSEGLSSWAYQNRQGALCIDTVRDERWVKFGDGGDEIQSALAVPFVYYGEIIAMMTLHRNTGKSFDELDLAYATEIAAEMVTFIEATNLRCKG